MESRGRRVTSTRPRALQSQFRWLTSEHQENATRTVGAARLFLAAQGERPFSHFLSYPLMRFTANVYRRPPDARKGGRHALSHGDATPTGVRNRVMRLRFAGVG